MTQPQLFLRTALVPDRIALAAESEALADWAVKALESNEGLIHALRLCALFMENVAEDDPTRNERFFECRHAWRVAWDKACA